MPQTAEVEGFLRSIGPFYEIEPEDEGKGEEEKKGEEKEEEEEEEEEEGEGVVQHSSGNETGKLCVHQCVFVRRGNARTGIASLQVYSGSQTSLAYTYMYM